MTYILLLKETLQVSNVLEIFSILQCLSVNYMLHLTSSEVAPLVASAVSGNI